jgi:hypothetical protein
MPDLISTPSALSCYSKIEQVLQDNTFAGPFSLARAHPL